MFSLFKRAVDSFRRAHVRKQTWQVHVVFEDEGAWRSFQDGTEEEVMEVAKQFIAERVLKLGRGVRCQIQLEPATEEMLKKASDA